MIETLITNVSLGKPGETTAMGIQSGVFVSIDNPGKVTAKWELDAGGCLMLPGLVEPHAHIDKSYSPITSTYSTNTDATMPPESALRQAIVNMVEIKSKRTLNEIEHRARQSIERAISKGVCHLRSHLDLNGESDIPVVECLIDLRDQYRDKIRIEYSLLCSLETTAQKIAAAKALELGADCVGGAPALTDEPEVNIDRTLEFAQQFDRPVDLHIDETHDPASNCLEYLAERVIDLDFQLPVVASHCCSLAFMDEDDQARTIEKIARAGIHIVSLPECNLGLIGRDLHPAPRGATPIKKLLAAGVNVCSGSDNVQDPFQPWGDYEPLGTACATALVAQLNTREEIDTPLSMITHNAANAMGIAKYGIEAGNRADFCLLRCTGSQQAIAERSLRTWVFFDGKPVVKQTLEQVWIDANASKKSLINPLTSSQAQV